MIIIKKYEGPIKECDWGVEAETEDMYNWICNTCFTTTWLPKDLYPLKCRDLNSEN